MAENFNSEMDSQIEGGGCLWEHVYGDAYKRLGDDGASPKRLVKESGGDGEEVEEMSGKNEEGEVDEGEEDDKDEVVGGDSGEMESQGFEMKSVGMDVTGRFEDKLETGKAFENDAREVGLGMHVEKGNETGHAKGVMRELHMRMHLLEAKHHALEETVRKLSGALGALEKNGSGGEDQRMRVISKEQLRGFIFEAVGSCTTGIGCSKAYIRKYLQSRFDVPNSQHYARKTGLILADAISSGQLSYDPKHCLYRM